MSQRHKKTPETAKVAENASGMGLRQEEIATLMGITRQTLAKRYRKELDTGLAKANFEVSQSLFKNAVSNANVTAQIWWEKTRQGKKAVDALELKNPPGEAFRTESLPAEPELIGEYLARLQALATDRAAGAAARRMGPAEVPDAGGDPDLMPD